MGCFSCANICLWLDNMQMWRKENKLGDLKDNCWNCTNQSQSYEEHTSQYCQYCFQCILDLQLKLEKVPPGGIFQLKRAAFFYPAEGCSLRLQRYGPAGPGKNVFCFDIKILRQNFSSFFGVAIIA